MKVVLRWVVMGLLVSALVGCVRPPVSVCSSAGLKKLTQTIETEAGGQYVELGDQVFIDIPAWYLFKANSSNLTAKGRHLLLKVAQRMSCYTTKAIRVTAYTGVLPHPVENKALGAQRAKQITSILLSRGMTRLIYQYSVPIANKCQFCRLNRIEIVTNQLH